MCQGCTLRIGVAQMLALQLQKIEKFVIVRQPKDTLMESSTMRLAISRLMSSNAFFQMFLAHFPASTILSGICLRKYTLPF